ncbi:MAG: recombinase family protein [Oscillospiraceae bacterium]|nr:recombinase family protein [Oscillospiraceae bacterium]
MTDNSKRTAKQEAKEKVRRRINVTVDPDNYEYIPEKKKADYYDTDIQQRVAIYVRVSTDDIRQTTSYELQKKYYEDFVNQRPNWTLAGIYADEGISGTSLKHRDAFNRMIADCKAGKIDLIITKSVSRFARNVMITIGMARELSHLKPPVGIFFESECIFSLNDDSQMALTFQATMAEEESHTRSRSMETSLRMRLDNGIPLTPKLLGYAHDADGNLVINPEEAPTVKLAFYMYLYGYSTQQIADAFNALGKTSYLGNINWTSAGIVQILRNERHCGDVLTRKTFTEDFRTHRTLKNRGDRPQSRYINHHEAIVSRDDFIAVQRMLDNAKYGNRSVLPELRVIREGILKGYVSVNPRWGSFTAEDYYRASQSVYGSPEELTEYPEDTNIEFSPGDLDLRGFEITRSSFFSNKDKPFVRFSNNSIQFSTECVRKFGKRNRIELLVHPLLKRFAIRPAQKENRNSVVFSYMDDLVYYPRTVSASAFFSVMLELMGWNSRYRYKVYGFQYGSDDEIVFIFDTDDSEAYILADEVSNTGADPSVKPFSSQKGRITGIPQQWARSFGSPYYLHELSLSALDSLDRNEWAIMLEGQLFETGKRLNVTPFDTLKAYIRTELAPVTGTEASR